MKLRNKEGIVLWACYDGVATVDSLDHTKAPRKDAHRHTKSPRLLLIASNALCVCRTQWRKLPISKNTHTFSLTHPHSLTHTHLRTLPRARIHVKTTLHLLNHARTQFSKNHRIKIPKILHFIVTITIITPLHRSKADNLNYESSIELSLILRLLLKDL